MKSQIGTFQEELPSGKIAASWMRKASAVALLIFLGYMIFAGISYEYHFIKFVSLRTGNLITEQSFNLLISTQKRFDWDIVVILLTAIFVPKAIQKFAEAKTGGIEKTDNPSTSIKTV